MKYPQATVEELLEADAALTAEDWDRAHALYEALYARCADNENIHAGLGFAAYKSGNIDAALRHFSAACIRRQEPKWIMFLIDALLTGGSTLAAWRLLDFAEKQLPEIHQQLLALGVIYRATQSMDQMMPSDGSLGWNVADDAELSPLKEKATLITQALVDGDNRRALELGKELGATHTLNPGLAVNIGLAFKRVGDFGEARKLYIRSFRACPSHGSACANLGNLMIENGEVTQAIRFLQAGVIAEGPAPEIDRLMTQIGQLDPIAAIAVLVLDYGVVDRLELGNGDLTLSQSEQDRSREESEHLESIRHRKKRNPDQEAAF